jgi:Putative beta-barrel porin-2, OmpL-like. bbp2
MLSIRKRSYGCETLVVLTATVWALTLNVHAQESQAHSLSIAESASANKAEHLQQTVSDLQAEVAMLKERMKEMQAAMAIANGPSPGGPAPELTYSTVDLQPGGGTGAVLASDPSQAPQSSLAASTADKAAVSPEDRSILDFLKGTSTNVLVDGYYEYNFNDPIGRVNLLRAYDVLSNAFSLNQAALVFERAADPAAGRRFGTRLDLQFGQATASTQGSPSNEHRPDIYRNIFQAYGTYVVPAGSGITVDFGKWASSLGYEGTYTKDQINYSRSYWFNYLPFYHMGFRAKYQVNDKLGLNYWIVNGTNQTEPTNGFKDEMFGFVLTPTKHITWTANYYFGQENPDSTPVPSCGPVPVQQGLCFVPITPAPNGKLHIFDTYLNWQATPKLTLALEGDYVIQRVWANAAPGQSSAPSHTSGGAAYAQYLFTSRQGIGARGEYLSDRSGLFSGVVEALKEVTFTYDLFVADGFQVRTEYRRDWSNIPVFLTSAQNVFSKDQNTLTLGLIWWYGRKQGAW